MDGRNGSQFDGLSISLGLVSSAGTLPIKKVENGALHIKHGRKCYPVFCKCFCHIFVSLTVANE